MGRSKVSRLPFTAFAREYAKSAYALSMLLFQAEFSGLPRATELSRIQSNTAALVDHKRDPAIARNGQQLRSLWHIRSESAQEPSRWGFRGTPDPSTCLGAPCIMGFESGLRTGSPTVRGLALGTGSKCGAQRANAQHTTNCKIWLETNSLATHAMSSTPSSNVSKYCGSSPPFKSSTLSHPEIGVHQHHYCGTIHCSKLKI